VLEAILTLARGRVVSGHPQERTGPALEGWNIEAVTKSDMAEMAPVMLKTRWHRGLDRRVGDIEVTAADMSRELMVACLNWDSHGLIANGPDDRRRFLDWALFHVEQDYGALWVRWRRLLRQRNRALQERASRQTVSAWDESLSEAAESITRRRGQLVEFLANSLGSDSSVTVADVSLELAFDPGWDRQISYRDVLRQQLEQDQQRGRTGYGPQRANLQLCSGDQKASSLSRGQQKLALASILLAACRRIISVTGQAPILMVDDFESELAGAAKRKLAAALLRYPGQLLLTQHLDDRELWNNEPLKVFHVEHGQVTAALN